MAHTRLTSEALARVINKGFKDTASKEDIKGVKEGTKGITTRLDGIHARLDRLDARVGRIEADVHALLDQMVHRRKAAALSPCQMTAHNPR